MLVSKKAIRAWLENYKGIQANDRPIDAMPGNSGRKPDDGVTDQVLNRIMLEAGLAAMKQQAYGLYRVVCFRWIEETPLGKTLRYLGLDKGAYYRRCGYAIDFLYLHINGYYGKLDPFLSKIRQKATKCID